MRQISITLCIIVIQLQLWTRNSLKLETLDQLSWRSRTIANSSRKFALLAPISLIIMISFGCRLVLAQLVPSLPA